MDEVRSPEFDPARPFGSALDILRAIFLSPRAFFLDFSAEGSLREPTFFVLLVSAVSAVLRLALVLVFSTENFGEAALSLLESVVFVALSPVLVGAFGGAYLLSVRTFVGKVGTFREVYRMLAYAYGTMILLWVPIVQAFAFSYGMLVLMTFGIRSVYRTSTMTATITALVGYVPAAVLFIFLQFAVTRAAFG